ncbi:MAG TPA: TolC family protein, partial [Luteolibacter sp.]|nr:TolC family protein [Luteolibacter sp.]
MHPISPSIALWALSLTLLPAAENRLLDAALLGELRSEAARSHPAAIAGRHEAQAAAHEVRAVRLWMDPMVDIGFMAASKMMRIEDGDTMIGFEQALPRPGMFAAERSKMEAMRRASIQNAAAAANYAGALAAKAAIELALADESITLEEARLAWMNEIAVNARQMAADPMGGSADALRMETELAMERQMLDAARRNRERYAINLNLALGRADDAPWPALKLPATPPPAPVVQAELARVAHANPKVRAMHEMVGAAEADVRLARSERLPEVAV